jgi:uncharacterized membrane protein YphA (DoxX/SURF4 family)
MNIVLWIVQILLALLFMFAGMMKFRMSAEEMGANMPGGLSIGFLYFIAVCEILGGLGLVIPWATKTMPRLTPIAAAGLFIIMIGAVVVSFPMGAGAAAIPAVVGILLAFVVYGRTRSAASLP